MMRTVIVLLYVLCVLLPFPCEAGLLFGPNVRVTSHHYYGYGAPAPAVVGYSYSYYQAPAAAVYAVPDVQAVRVYAAPPSGTILRQRIKTRHGIVKTRTREVQ